MLTSHPAVLKPPTEPTPPKATILLVDDNPTNIQVLFDVLEEFGYRVAIAKSGEIALQRLQIFQPDIILLDVMMPGMDGFETCQRLKTNPATGDIPVIFMTALSDTVDKVKGLSLGAVDYVTKPIQHEETLARIQVHLQLRATQKALAQRTLELSTALTSLQQSQLQLVQSEKMSSLGQLVAGVAHEINNPINFIYGNLQPAEDYIQDLLHLIDYYQKYVPTPPQPVQDYIESIDLEFLTSDLQKLMNSMELGADRIRKIVLSLRNFSRLDEAECKPVNLHEGLDSTLVILHYRLKQKDKMPAIAIVKEYGDLPLVECYAGQLNQVFMNLLANAVDAIEEAYQTAVEAGNPGYVGQITIQTALSGNGELIEIRMRDNGMGMAPTIQSRIFDYLFTTKAPGKGTGIGLAIAHQIIVQKHHGSIHVDSTPGQGATFVIQLPLKSGAATQ